MEITGDLTMKGKHFIIFVHVYRPGEGARPESKNFGSEGRWNMQEEVYFFIRGDGKMELDGKEMAVKEGDTVLIEDGVFHKVHAGPKGCYFVCVFDGKRSH